MREKKEKLTPEYFEFCGIRPAAHILYKHISKYIFGSENGLDIRIKQIYHNHVHSITASAKPQSFYKREGIMASYAWTNMLIFQTSLIHNLKLSEAQ